MTISFFAQVVQESSTINSAQAALHSILLSYGLEVRPQQLASLSKVDEEGAAITKLAAELGLEITVKHLPIDYFGEEQLPAMVRLHSEEGKPRFVVVWNRVGPLFQVMDPQVGLCWLRQKELHERLFSSERLVEWATWPLEAKQDEFYTSLSSRLTHLEIETEKREALLKEALADSSWHKLATLDSATRMLFEMRQAGAVTLGQQAQEVLERLLEERWTQSLDEKPLIPAVYGSIFPLSDSEGRSKSDENWPNDSFQLRGIQLLQVVKVNHAAPPDRTMARAPSPIEPAASEQTVWHYLKQDGLLNPIVLGLGAALSAGAVILQVLLFYSFLQVGNFLTTPFERLVAILFLLMFVITLLLLKWPTYLSALRLGRRLESRLRMAMLEKSQDLSGSYFRDQSVADLTERVHSVSNVRYLPLLGLKGFQIFFEFILTLVAIAYVDLATLPFALLGVSGTLMWGIIAQPILKPRYLRLRHDIGNLSRFYLDGLLGLVAIRTHGAERNVKQEHQRLLVRWATHKLALHRIEYIFSNVDIFLFWIGLILTVVSYTARVGAIPQLLLLLYWVFRSSFIIQELLPMYSEYFSQQSKVQRFLEPLQVPDDIVATEPITPKTESDAHRGVKIEFREVNAHVASQPVLSDLNLIIEPGEHIAIVGRSGAGKSTLVGVLLGWYEEVSGEILIDGEPVTDNLLSLWQDTAWVDPSIQLWNRSLLHNLKYSGDQTPLSTVIEQADLIGILERLPDGLNTPLGEGGRLVSGGQGQRVRFGRALGRQHARLVILDEPFRGLDRDKRRTLLARARAFWADATLVCITHDVSVTSAFNRVLVVEAGKVVEDAAPEPLLREANSRYQALRRAEKMVQEGLFASSIWRSLWLENGKLSRPDQESKPSPPAPLPTIGEGSKSKDLEKASSLPSPSQPLSGHDLPTWSLSNIGEAIRLLAQKSGLPFNERANLPAFRQQAAHEWIPSLSQQLQLDSQSVTISYDELERLLQIGSPALLELPNQQFLLLLGKGFLAKILSSVSIIAPTGRTQRIKFAQIRDALSHRLDPAFADQLEPLLAHMPLSDAQQDKARRVLLDSQLKKTQINGIWLFQASADNPFWSQINVVKLPRYLMQTVTWHLLNRAFLFMSWGMIGYMVFLGHAYIALILAWLLLILSITPINMLILWLEKQLSIVVGILLRQRLFDRALSLSQDEIKQKGAGQFLSWVMGSEAVEEAILIETPGMIRALVELLVAFVLFLLSIPLAALCLLLWLGLTSVISWRFFYHELRWKVHYTEMTNHLVERMSGHQTRLVQEKRSQWHTDEDKALAHYYLLAQKRDQFEARLVALIPYGWLVIGLIGIAYRFTYQPDAATLAISFLAILTAFQALRGLSLKLRGMISAACSYRQMQPILQSSHDTVKQTHAAQVSLSSLPNVKHNQQSESATTAQVMLDARKLTFRYREHGRAILDQCNLRIQAGDRLLLEGPSGGGKSTLAALLAGLRQPNSGAILLHGLDWHTIGSSKWRQRVVYAPQFHENHILSGTLAFNLLMGRNWPASEEDFADAERICHELGLAALLNKMPLGLQQPVGESGWHLSHGERSRIYIARALLQQADLVILDESFGSLDPENMEIALRTVLKRAPTLLVIAHP